MTSPRSLPRWWKKEGVTIEDAALQLIARAADGSARDGLSLLDQAIALSQGNVTSDDVRAMLGLSDQSRILDLFKAIASGEPEEALALFDALYADGADPAGVIRSLSEFVHDLTRLHVTRGKADLGPGEANREAIMELGRGLSMPQLKPVLAGRACWLVGGSIGVPNRPWRQKWW